MSNDNPYDPPKTDAPGSKPRRYSAGRLIVGILLLVGMVPASAVAFFCCCLAGVMASENPGQPGADQALNVGMVTGSIGGIAAFALMLWGGIVMIRRSQRPPVG
jgi:hypothetical protein